LSNTNKCLIDEILNDDNDDIMDLVRKSRDIPIHTKDAKHDDRFIHSQSKDASTNNKAD